MAFIGGEQGEPASDFQNYVLDVIRKDFTTGELLASEGWIMTKPFKTRPTSFAPADLRGKIEEGAAGATIALGGL